MQWNFLTKSDFKVAQTCPTKLYYRKKGYPTRDDHDEYTAVLADQGYLLEAFARALHADGQWIGHESDVESAAWETMSAMTDACTLFEATFISAGKLARVDILVRRGNVIELIEVKSKSFDRLQNDALIRAGKPNVFRAKSNPDEIDSSWRPYIEDVAFQVSVLQGVFPEAQIVPYLMLPDTSRTCLVDGLHSRFTLRVLPDQDSPATAPSADYIGDPREIRRNPILAKVRVADEVNMVLSHVENRSAHYVEYLLPSLRRIVTPLSVHCKSCEYRVQEGALRGFHECWKELTDVEPGLLDIYRVRDLGSRKEDLANKLIAQGKVNLADIPETIFTRGKPREGEVARRQRIQISHTRENTEWVSARLGDILGTLSYPLHFVDFETCAPAIPRYRGMRPYETVAFQWSCQSLRGPDAGPDSSEWLQPADVFPNVTFAETLRDQLGIRGSILVWANHEATVLRAIQRQLSERGEQGSELYHWLGNVLDSGRLVDLNQLVLKHYFHPRMGGSTSVKIVADAVWQANPSIRARLPQY
ncbi:MAG TPA: DUF2779 domain-containing protein, partial [Promineifilum sp.]